MQDANNESVQPTELGAFSISLTVKELGASRAFYEKLGFSAIGGNPEHNWLILRNGTTIIGLFQGMFDKNILTFNPGWTIDQEKLEGFTDVRALKAAVVARGITPVDDNTGASERGPAHFVIVDPDGNQILIDQHV